MFEKTGKIHRGPIGFGPAASPRQGPDGKPFSTWKADSEMHLTGTVFNISRESLQGLLPEGYIVDPDQTQPTILFEVMNLRKLPWLAGRGYNTWGIYANDVICQRVNPPVKASYMVVLFESFTDPITTGREELGFCKVWAEMPDPKIENGNLVHTASWYGTEFLRLEVPNLVSRPVEEAPGHQKRPYTHPSVEGVLHHRYIPAVGEPGKHDASYATHMPTGGSNKPKSVIQPDDPGSAILTKSLLKFASTSGPLSDIQLKVTSHPWEDLPTLWNIVDGLKALELGLVREFYHQVEKSASDCSRNKRIEF